jgi:tRNA(Ile)-lysidine synthase
MRPVDGLWRRPLLTLTREHTRQACAAAGLRPWDDPHNDDITLARSRVRRQVLPMLEADLGPGVAAALARTADLLRADADLLDALAEPVAARVVRPGPPACVDTKALAAEPAALRTRVLLGAARAAGCPPSELTADHVHGLDALVTGTHGGAGLDLPGGVRAQRRGTDLLLARRGVTR